MPEQFKVLGIDPGSLKIGWAVLTAGIGLDTELHAHGLHKLNEKTSIEKRCAAIHVFMRALLLQFQVDTVVVEDIPFVRHQKTVIPLTLARGAILGACYEHEATSLSVSTWKAQTVGSSKAEKKVVQQYVRQYFQLAKPLSTDESDAVGIALVKALELRRNGYLQGELL